MVAGAIVAGVSAVASVASSKSQSDAAKKASRAQQQAADAATELQREIYQDQRALSTPTALSGANAQARRMLMTGSSVGDANKYLGDTYAAYGVDGDAPTLDGWNAQSWLESTPGYQFRLGEGRRAVERSASARSGLFSGRAGKELERYGQDYGSGEWDKLYRQLGEQSGDGQNATGTIINVAGQYGDAAGRNTIAAGDARASGYLAKGNANANMWAGFGRIAGQIGGYGQGGGWFG